jgi:hypothetical protein
MAILKKLKKLKKNHASFNIFMLQGYDGCKNLDVFFYTVGLLIFPILLQHILKLLRYFSYIFVSVQVSASYRATHGELIFCVPR